MPRFGVQYMISSAIDLDAGAIKADVILVDADDEVSAKRVAEAWIIENDPVHDDRIQPLIEIVDVDIAPDGDDLAKARADLGPNASEDDVYASADRYAHDWWAERREG